MPLPKGFHHSEETKKKIKEHNVRYWLGKKNPNMIGDKNPKWKGGKPKCIDCNKQLTNYKTKRCLACNGKYQSGENSPVWVGGKYKKQDLRNDSAYQYFVKKVKKRDNHKCKINNKDCKGYCIVHHILGWTEFPELRYEVNNGITLCLAHHPRKRAEEKRLIPFFKELVAVSKL